MPAPARTPTATPFKCSSTRTTLPIAVAAIITLRPIAALTASQTIFLNTAQNRDWSIIPDLAVFPALPGSGKTAGRPTPRAEAKTSYQPVPGARLGLHRFRSTCSPRRRDSSASAEHRAENRPRRTRLLRSLQHYSVCPSGASLSLRWGRVMAEGQTLGRPLLAGEAWIAATALELDLLLVTHNPGNRADPDSGFCRARAKSKAHRRTLRGSGGVPLLPSVGDLAIAIGEVGVIQVQMGRMRWRRPGSGRVAGTRPSLYDLGHIAFPDDRLALARYYVEACTFSLDHG